MSICTETDTFSLSAQPKAFLPSLGRGSGQHPSSRQPSPTCSVAEAFLARVGKEPPLSKAPCLLGGLCSALAHVGPHPSDKRQWTEGVQHVDSRAGLPSPSPASPTCREGGSAALPSPLGPRLRNQESQAFQTSPKCPNCTKNTHADGQTLSFESPYVW